MHQLTRAASQRVDWDALTDAVRLSLTETDSNRGGTTPTEAGAVQNVEVIQRAFDLFKREFAAAAGTMQKTITLSIVIMMIALALAIAGGVLLFSKPWAGGTLSASAMATVFGLIQRVRLLARDEVMLRLIPAKYEVALQLSVSRTQYEKVLSDMLREMNSLRA